MKRPRGTGSVFRRGRIWWTWWEGEGESSGSTNKQAAIERLKERMKGTPRALPTTGDLGYGDVQGMLLADMRANGRRSVDNVEKYRLPHLRSYFGAMRAGDIEHSHLCAYVVQRRDTEKAKPATVAHELKLLRRMLALAVTNRRLSGLPAFPGLSVNNARQGFATPEQVERIVSHLPAHAQPIVRALFLTGWRSQEIIGLEWKAVDLEAGTLRIETSKTDKARAIPLGELLGNLLRQQREETSQLERSESRVIRWVFHLNGERIGSIRTAWRNAVRKAGLPGLTPHDLRRSAAVAMLQSGMTETDIMARCGWTTRAMFVRYCITDLGRLEQGIRGFDAFLKAPRRGVGQV